MTNFENIITFRLPSNEDIIGIKCSSGYIHFPVVINYDYEEEDILWKHWLPLALIKENKALIDKNQILCSYEVEEYIKEFYLNLIVTCFNDSSFLSKEDFNWINLQLELYDAKISNNIH